MIKQFVPQEVCLKCEGCCRFTQADSVWLPCLLDKEIQDLLEKKIPPVSISAKRKIQPILNPAGDGYTCAFFNPADNKCKIYDLRPFECQLYPFIINLRGKKVLLTVDLNCPYVKENMNKKEFEDYVNYLSAYLNSPEQLEMLKDNPQIIQAYEDVLDVIELNVPK